MNTAALTPSTKATLRRAGQVAAAILHAGARCQTKAGTRLLDELLTLLDGLSIRPTATGSSVTATSKIAAGFKLSNRELEILVGLSQGHGNLQIAAELFISEDTVKTHARRLYRKLGAHDRAHAVAIAFRRGLLT